MPDASFRTPGQHRRLIATVLTGVLAVSGLAVLGVALTRGGQVNQATPPRVAASAPTTEAPVTPTPTALVLPASKPVSITIPAIGVESSLLRLGQAADGTLEVPAPGRDYDKAGWYRYSPTPGVLGPAVIVGHVDSATDGPSVFFRLENLRPKDRVRVTRTDGSVAIFEVDDVRTFRKARFPTRLVYGDTDHAALRLITCGGPFDGAGHYRDNVVVLASLVGSEPGGRNTPA
jgi:sortase (surface protein transpeptidase)